MDSDEAFLRDKAISRRKENDWAVKIRERGFRVWLPPERIRPDSTVRADYSDDGDLMMQGRIEHKVRDLMFTCREDYPYPTIIVDECRIEDAKSSDPVIAYVIENRDGTCAAVVYGWTRSRWERISRWDQHRNRQRDFYVVDKSLVRFCHPSEAF